MDLTVVGCSGSTSGPGSPASSYLVQAPYEGRTFTLVLDLGPGAFGALYRQLDPSQVDAVALTHLHPDHCLDVCAYYVAATYSPSAPWPRRPLYGPPGTAERLARAYDVDSVGAAAESEWEPGILRGFDYHDWQERQQIGPFRVSTARVEHSAEAYAIRVEERAQPGRVLVYSGDTGPCDALVGLARGADVLLVEASFREGDDDPPGLHLTGRQAAEAATEAGVGRVVLTHIPPWHEPSDVLAEAAPHFAGPVEVATPGGSYPIG